MIYRDGKARPTKEQLELMKKQQEEEDKKQATDYKDRMQVDPVIFNKEEARTEDLHL